MDMRTIYLLIVIFIDRSGTKKCYVFYVVIPNVIQITVFHLFLYTVYLKYSLNRVFSLILLL